jgi:hypothetical protein
VEDCVFIYGQARVSPWAWSKLRRFKLNKVYIEALQLGERVFSFDVSKKVEAQELGQILKHC